MTLEYPVKYLQTIREKTCSEGRKLKYAEGVGVLLAHFTDLGYIPRCYSHVMSKLDNEDYITNLYLMSEEPEKPAFQPSKALELRADAFFVALSERHYSIPPEQAYGCIFTNFFIFLELNCIPYSRRATQLWLETIAKTTTWEQKRTIITWFANYAETGDVQRPACYVWRTLLIDDLPGWSRKITEDYIAVRQKEDRAHSTLMMIRSSCVRFFRFLDVKGVKNPAEITPALVKEFHVTDAHATPHAKNAYGTRVRRLLQYMADEQLVPPHLYLAVSTRNAETRRIVGIMDEEMIAAIYDYRAKAASPYE
jgi:hypothetical protein